LISEIHVAASSRRRLPPNVGRSSSQIFERHVRLYSLCFRDDVERNSKHRLKHDELRVRLDECRSGNRRRSEGLRDLVSNTSTKFCFSSLLLAKYSAKVKLVSFAL
jgi:hypothetical protein